MLRALRARAARAAMAPADHRRVAVLAALLCTSSLLSVVALGVILAHWHDALDACVHADCGCLLYARVASSTYAITGSDVSLCWFGGTAPLPGLVVGLVLAAVYGYLGFVRTPRHRRRVMQVVRAADGSGARFLVPQALPTTPPASTGTSDGPGTPAATGAPPSPRTRTRTVLCVNVLVMQGAGCFLLGLVALSHAALLTDGILVTCREYRHAVLKTLSASGSLAELVNERLSCPVIFDFLDYMKPDVREINQGNHWFPGQRRLTTVNTSAALVISLISAYATSLLWVVIAFKFGRMAQRATRSARYARAAGAGPRDAAAAETNGGYGALPRRGRMFTTDL